MAGQSRYLWQAGRDLVTGLAIFGVLAVALCCDITGGTWTSAAASDAVLSQVLELSSPAGPGPENATIAALVNRPTFTAELARPSAITALAIAFALMFTLNLAILRHLRRVYASPRRRGWRRGR